MTSTSARNGQRTAHKIHKVSLTVTTAVNCQPRRKRFKQFSQLFCFKPREIHGPTLMEFLSPKAVMQRLAVNERWRAIGMLKLGSIQLNIVKQLNVSQSISSMQTTEPPSADWECDRDLPRSGCPRSTTPRQDHLLFTNN